MLRIRCYAVAAALAVVCVGVAPQDAAAQVLNLAPVVDGSALDSTGDGTFDSVSTTGTSISIRNFPGTVIERGLLEFSTSGIPAGATVNSVTFQFEEVGFTGSSSPVEIFGYAGNGSLALGDATASGTLLGSYDPVAAGLGPESVALSVAGFNTVRAGSPTVGLRFQTTTGTTNTQFASTEGGTGSFDPPVLVVNYTPVPEPTSAAAALLAGAGLLARRRRSSSRA